MSARLILPGSGIQVSQPVVFIDYDLGSGTALKWPALTYYASNPIVSPSAATPVELATYTPQVIRIDASTWKMLFKSERGITLDGNERNCIKAAESSDGLSWSRLNSDAGVIFADTAWEVSAGYNIEQPVLFYDGSTYHCYYTCGNANTCAIGYATSSDLVTWSKSGSNPIMDLTDFSGWPVTAEWMYLTAVIPDLAGDYWGFGWCGDQLPDESWDNRIWYSKGTSWTDLVSVVPPTVLFDDGALNDGMQTETGVFNPHIIKINSTYYMLYHATGSPVNFLNLEIHWASSSNLTTWTKGEVFPGFSLPQQTTDDSPANWDLNTHYTPYIIRENTAPYLAPQEIASKYWFYFSGSGSGTYRVGKAELATGESSSTAYDNTLLDLPLNEGTGTTLTDLSDYGNDCTFPTDAAWVAEEKSLYNGIQQAGIICPTTGFLQRDYRTIELWCSFSVDGRNQAIWVSTNTTGGSNASMSLSVTSTGNIAFYVRSTNVAEYAAPLDLDYHHVVAVLDFDTGRQELWLDGVMVDSFDIVTAEVTTWGDRPLVANYVRWLDDPIVADVGFTGKVKDLQLHRLPLTATQIQQRYNRGPRYGTKEDVSVTSLSTSITARWGLGESAGSQRDDSVGTAHLSDNNTVGTTTGKNGNCADFTAASSHFLSVADSAAISVGGTDFTFAVWCRPTTSNIMGVFGKYSGTAATSEYLLYRYSDRKYYWDVINSSGSAAECATAATTNSTWHLVICWRDVTNDKLWIQVNDAAPVSANLISGNADAANPLWVGKMTLSPTDYYFQGQIDELMFWKRVLTPKERTDLFGNTVGRFYSTW